MTKQLTDDIVQGMLSFLDNAQLKQLRDVVETTLSGYEITERKETNDSFHVQKPAQNRREKCISLRF